MFFQKVGVGQVPTPVIIDNQSKSCIFVRLRDLMIAGSSLLVPRKKN